MTRHVRRASALILASALFAAGAWGQTVTLRQWASSIDVAAEYFGAADGREVGRDVKGNTADPLPPRITVTIHGNVSPDDGTTVTAGAIDEGNIARITYALRGATFAETVSSSNLTGANLAGDAVLETEIVSGGAEGDSSVTIEVEVAGGNIASDDTLANNRAVTGTPPRLVFEVPMLQVTGAVLETDPLTGATVKKGVTVTASIAPRRSRSNPFPTVIQGADADGMADGSTVGAKVDKIALAQSQVYNMLSHGLDFAWGAPQSNVEQVSVRDRKTIIAVLAKTKDPSVKNPDDAGPALRIGTINISPPASIPRDLGGEDPAVITTDDDDAQLPVEEREVGDGLSGDAVVTVYGPFQTGDKVYLGTRSMSIDGGAAMGSMGIESLLRSEDGMNVIYVPGGVDDLKPRRFVATAALDFDDSDNSSEISSGPPGPPFYGVSQGTLQYRGFSSQGYAYGVVRGGGMEQSQVRVTCEASTACVIFADCTDQAGMSYFGGPVQVGPGATEVVSSDEIAAALDGGWSSGRGRCDMVSSGALSVQHMVRSGDALINNSLVVNKPVAPFPAIPGVATYSCVPADGPDENTEADESDHQRCSPIQAQ